MTRNNCKIETISLNIRKFTCRVTQEIKYEVKKFNKRKVLNTEKEAQKTIDLWCIEKKKKQVYNSYKAI